MPAGLHVARPTTGGPAVFGRAMSIELKRVHGGRRVSEPGRIPIHSTSVVQDSSASSQSWAHGQRRNQRLAPRVGTSARAEPRVERHLAALHNALGSGRSSGFCRLWALQATKAKSGGLTTRTRARSSRCSIERDLETLVPAPARVTLSAASVCAITFYTPNRLTPSPHAARQCGAGAEASASQRPE